MIDKQTIMDQTNVDQTIADQAIADKTIEEVTTQLEDWFSKQLPRGHKVAQSELIVNLESAKIAARLYKRHGIVIEGTKPFQFPTLKPQDTQVLSFTTWQDCFQQSFFHNAEIIIDENVLATLPMSVTLNRPMPHIHTVTATETNKNLQTVFELVKKTSAGTQTVVSIGGGITSDIAGCVAGLANKQLIVIPTTWLAAIDAAMGGKNGVNHPVFGKNQIGLFLNPSAFVLVDEALLSLPRAAFLCGFAEALKHSYLAGNNSLANSKHLTDTAKLNSSTFIRPHLEFKRQVVTFDPFEQDLRRTLNFGHTYAHVLEALGEQGFIKPIPHGAAVAIGMHIKTNNQSIPNAFAEALKLLLDELLELFPLQVLKTTNIKQTIVTLLQADKKRVDDLVSLVIPRYGLFKNIDRALESDYIAKKSLDSASEDLISYLDKNHKSL